MKTFLSLARSFRERLWTPVDGASLGVVRIAMGLLLTWEVVYRANIYPPASGPFRYPYFEWLPDFPGMDIWFRGALVICGLLLVAGIWSRLVALFAAVLVAYGFLLVPEHYLNHIYLFGIYLFLFALVPSNRDFALRLPFGLAGRPGNVRYIHILLLKLQTEIVLIYAGLVKLNPDWLAMVPLHQWLLQRRGELFYSALLDYDLIVAAANYGVIALHLVGAPLLFFRATRLPVFIVYCVFHLTNHHTFEIGIFPWLTITASTLFFEPNWPRVLLRRIGFPVADASLPGAKAHPRRAMAYAAFCAVWLTFQVLIPLRHYLYPGDVGWTSEGYRFAWRMMLVDYRVEAFWAIVHVPSKEAVILADLKPIIGRRVFLYQVSCRPDLILQMAREVAATFGGPRDDLRVYIYDLISWNFRPPRLLVDPKVNLVEKHDSIWPTDWLIHENDGVPVRYEEYEKRTPVQVDHTVLLDAAGFQEYSDCRQPPILDPLVKWICKRPAQMQR